MPSSAWRSTLFPYTTLFRSDRKSTRLNSSHSQISYAVFCLKKKNISGHAQRAQRALVVFAFHDDRRAAILFREVLEDPLQVGVELLPVHPLTHRSAR